MIRKSNNYDLLERMADAVRDRASELLDALMSTSSRKSSIQEGAKLELSDAIQRFDDTKQVLWENGQHPMKKGLGFGDALPMLRDGCRMARAGWDDGVYVKLVTPMRDLPAEGCMPSPWILGLGKKSLAGTPFLLDTPAFFVLFNEDRNRWVPGWTPQVEDLLAADWCEIGET